MTVTIYHNPRCTKSRQTLALLEEKGVKPKIVEYLKEPPSAAELKRVLKKLGLKPRDIVRQGESVYAELGLKDKDLKDDELIALMVKNPILIERPIVVSGDKAAIGRPPESVLEILRLRDSRARLGHFACRFAPEHLEHAHHHPDREHDDRAEQEVAERLLDRGETHVVDALCQVADVLEEIVGAEAQSGEDDAHDQR